MSDYDKYLNVITAECIKPIANVKQVEVGQKYRLGLRYNAKMKKEMYYLLDIKSPLGTHVYVDIESEYFKPEELDSISFILS